MSKINNFNKKGFVLLYALLVSSVILGVGASLVNIVTKQVILSTVGRDSQFAYYAADAGAKCAAFWNSSPVNVFGLISEDQNGDPYIIPPDFGDGLFGGEEAVFCRGSYQNVSNDLSSNDTIMVSNFQVDFVSGSQRTCALVEVSKDANTGSVRIISNGYNTACDDTANDRRIERTVVTEF